jgi:transglutaminase-like putative cysteine protease
MMTVTSNPRGSTAARRSAPTPAANLRMSGLLLVALAIATAGLHSILSDYTWWYAAFGVIFVIFAAAAIARHFLRSAWMGTLAAVVAGVLVVTLFFGGSTAFLGLIPTPGTFRHFGVLLAQANDSIAHQSVPAVAITGIQFVVCWSIGLIAVALDAVAIWWRSPALAGVPLFVVIAVPSFVRSEFSDSFVFALTAIVYLVIVRVRLRRIQPAVAFAVGAVGIVGALLVPVILPPVSPASANGSGFGTLSERINPIIDLGQDLRNADPVQALTYTTTSQTGQYLRLTTLDKFDGQQWAPTVVRSDSSNSVHKIAAAPGLTAKVPTTSVTTHVQVGSATGSWLPTPYPSTSISGLTGAWYWQNGALSVRSDSADTAGQKYTVKSLEVTPTVPQLRAAPSSSTSPYAKVPTGLAPIVAATARKVVGKAKTDFDKAIALQTWFTSGVFKYSTKAPAIDGFDGSGLDIIVPFLKAKTGYCVHFATTMAVMARTLGIPSRVAVGFLPGKLEHAGGSDTSEIYEVSSGDLHAWPELYFKNIGWVRFEPTPGKGFEPSFPLTASTTPGGGASAAPILGATASPSASSSVAPRLPNGQAQQLNNNAVTTSTGSGFSLNWLFLVALVILLLLPAMLRGTIRRRRLDRIRRSIHPEVGAWEELRDTARDLGLDATDSATPAQLSAYLDQFLVSHTGRRSAKAREALARLRADVEIESYGVPQYNFNGENIARSLGTVLRGLRGASTASSRARAIFIPPTLFERMVGRGSVQRAEA